MAVLKHTNPDYEPSDCMRCDRREGMMCKLWPDRPERWEPIEVTMVTRTKCGYYDPYGEWRK